MQIQGDPQPGKYKFCGDLPPGLHKLLANCPESGSGERLVHRWIMECGNQLRHFVLIDTAAELIRRNISRRAKPREIEESLEKAYGEAALAVPSRSWPLPNARLIDITVSEYDEGTPGLVLLRKRSQAIPKSAAELFALMFPDDPLLCVGLYQANATIAPRSRLTRPERFQFVVPNPMKAKFHLDPGTSKRKERCLANTLERRYIVTDFDLRGDWIEGVLRRWARVKYTPQDGMATLIGYMERDPAPAPLVLVVFSGNVSLQAWFYALGADPDKLAAWFNCACLLGADPAGWVRCQYFRMPRGIRKETGKEQEIVYFNPDVINPP